MNPENRERDALTAGYRRASSADAGRPPASVREAILAEAAAAARRRAPAANNSRYTWRAVAGVAVLGFGVLLWREVDREQPLTQIVHEPVQADVVLDQVVLTEARERVAPQPPAPASQKKRERAPAKTTAREAANAAPSGPVVPDPFPATEATLPETAPVLAPPVQAPDATAPLAVAPAPPAPPAPASPAATPPGPPAPPAFGPPPARGPAAGGGRGGARRGNAPADASTSREAEALLRTHFPALYDAEAPATVWLMRNAAGEVVRSGELQPDQQLPEIMRAQQREAARASTTAVWRLEIIRNARGQPIRIYIAPTP